MGCRDMEDGTCCVTGHRIIPNEKLEYVRSELRREIEEAIGDGYKCFISGFAAGVDILFAQCVVEASERYSGIFLEAAIPYSGRLNQLRTTERTLLCKCSSIKTICDEYRRDCFMLRNHYMVQRSSRVIAVFDGRNSGGTAQTIRAAHANSVDARIIQI